MAVHGGVFHLWSQSKNKRRQSDMQNLFGGNEKSLHASDIFGSVFVYTIIFYVNNQTDMKILALTILALVVSLPWALCC